MLAGNNVDWWQGRQSAIAGHAMVGISRDVKVAVAGLPDLAGMPSEVRMPSILDEAMVVLW